MKELDIQEALKLADESQRQSSLVYLVADEPIAKQMSQMFLNYSAMIRRLVEELDKKQQGLVEASAMLVNYKCELDLERTMSAQLKEELEKQK